MNFKKTRIKQIETSLETLNKRFKSLAKNEFKEVEEFKVQAVANGMNLLDNYFKSLENNDDPEVEELRKEYNKLLDRISDHNPV